MKITSYHICFDNCIHYSSERVYLNICKVKKRLSTTTTVLINNSGGGRDRSSACSLRNYHFYPRITNTSYHDHRCINKHLHQIENINIEMSFIKVKVSESKSLVDYNKLSHHGLVLKRKRLKEQVHLSSSTK